MPGSDNRRQFQNVSQVYWISQNTPRAFATHASKFVHQCGWAWVHENLAFRILRILLKTLYQFPLTTHFKICALIILNVPYSAICYLSKVWIVWANSDQSIRLFCRSWFRWKGTRHVSRYMRDRRGYCVFHWGTNGKKLTSLPFLCWSSLNHVTLRYITWSDAAQCERVVCWRYIIEKRWRWFTFASYLLSL